MSPRSAPRKLESALRGVRESVAPATLLAAVQERWADVAGDAIATEAQPVSEREGVVTVACRSATWAQELDLLGGELIGRLRAELDDPAAGALRGLRFTADAARHAEP